MKKHNIFDFLGKKIELSEIYATGAKLLDQIAFKELALHIGVSYIANTLSKCEIKTYENGVETKGKLYYMLNVSPNANENSSQFINKFIENYYYKGHALLVPHGEGLYCADDFDIDETNPLKGFSFYNIGVGDVTLKKRFKASEVFYLKLDNKNVKTLIDSVYAQYGQLLDMAMQSYKRTNGKKYKLLLENYQAGDKKFKDDYENVIKAQLKAFVENDNAVYPQFRGQSLEEFGNSTPSNSSDIIAMRKEIFEITAQALKIPLPMMYGNITNMNEIVKVYLSICADPLADMVSEELTRKYYTFEEWAKGNFVKVDTSCINHVDILELADKVEKILGCGALNIDDVRERIGMAPLNTDFSTSHFITKNFDLAQNVLKGEKGGENE